MSFANIVKEDLSHTYTENGAQARTTSGDSCLDFFSTIGALRGQEQSRVINLLENAYDEDKLTATRIMFYSRDVRKGLGERDLFRTMIRHMADRHPEAVRPNIHLIGEYGRYDDLYCLVGTSLEADMWAFMKSQFLMDVENMKANRPVSVLAKWIKTADSKNKKTRELGILTSIKLGYKVYDFKRLVRALRKHIDVVEVKMTQNSWSDIHYSAVPSRAMMNYRTAFKRHDAVRFDSFIKKVQTGEEKINSSTLYPYDIMEKYITFCWDGIKVELTDEDEAVLQAQWDNLPNYVEEGTNAIVVADVSGSMEGRPLCSALGLAIYFAQRNSGPFHDLFMSFSSDSHFNVIKGSSLRLILENIDMSDWDMSTNLMGAFENILNVGVSNNLPKEDMPKSIIVVSDMEIDACCDDDWSFYNTIKNRYAEHGYEIPNVVFWNVESRHNIFHADKDRVGVQLVSGQSAATFKNLVESVGKTPIEMMRMVIDSDRYAPVTVE